ncbi:unnamed protein product, partial [Ectocarpus sp. 12 AP-2014]
MSYAVRPLTTRERPRCITEPNLSETAVPTGLGAPMSMRSYLRWWWSRNKSRQHTPRTRQNETTLTLHLCQRDSRAVPGTRHHLPGTISGPEVYIQSADGQT